MDAQVSIAEDPLDPRGLPKAFDYEGVPKQRVELVENGVLRGVVWDRETAAKTNGEFESTGSTPPDSWKFLGPNPFSLSMAGGDAASTEELAERVGDGIYITRLHYLSIVQPREGILTGMTRDGTFRIRDGKVAEPLVNLRFTVAVPDVLGEVHGLTREPMLVNLNELYDDRYPFGALVPGLATAKFNITGLGSGPGL
jgi:PmbA protein